MPWTLSEFSFKQVYYNILAGSIIFSAISWKQTPAETFPEAPPHKKALKNQGLQIGIKAIVFNT
jgi:hypothetical protein